MSGYPCRWRPWEVRNPKGGLSLTFTEPAAWELIAAKIEDGCELNEIALRNPEGRRAYVMLVELQPDRPKLYVKLQLGAGKIIGRSFHYTRFNP